MQFTSLSICCTCSVLEKKVKAKKCQVQAMFAITYQKTCVSSRELFCICITILLREREGGRKKREGEKKEGKGKEGDRKEGMYSISYIETGYWSYDP